MPAVAIEGCNNAPIRPLPIPVQEFAYTAMFADAPIGPDNIVPIGWAHMAPMVISKDASFFVPVFRPCSPDHQRYCLNVLRDGINPDLDKDAYVAEDELAMAHQPPAMFLLGSKILVVSWQGGGSIAVHALDVQGPRTQPIQPRPAIHE